MIFKKKMLYFMMAGTLFLAVSCSSSKDSGNKKTEEDNYYSGKLTADEMNGEHLKTELCKNVTVDADITPQSKYKDGLKVYFTKRSRLDAVADLKKYKKNPTVFGKPWNSLLDTIEENSKVKFNKKKTITYKDSKYDTVSINTPYTDSDGNDMLISCFVDFDKNKKPLSESIFFTAHDVDSEKATGTTDDIMKVQFGTDMFSLTKGKGMPDLAFGTKDEIGQKMLGVIADLKNTDIYTSYDCVTMNEEAFNTAVEKIYNLYGNNYDVKPFKSDYYVYLFPFMVDGIKWRSDYANMMLDVMNSMGDDVKISNDIENIADTIYPLNANPQVIACDAEGIQELQLSNELELSDVYKDNLEILPLDEVMSILKDYFSSKASLVTNINSIQLRYTGDFSNAEDGEMRNTAKPYWYVDYSKEMADRTEELYMLIDVSNGKIYD